MKKTFRQTSLIMASALILAVSPITAHAVGTAATVAKASEGRLTVNSTSVTYNFDGKDLSLPSGVLTFNYKGTTYVPVRFVSYALQKNVTWDNKTKQLKIEEPNAAQKVAIREKLINLAVEKTLPASAKSVSVLPVDVTYQVYGKKKQVAAGQFSFSHDGALYVPLRFLAEATGVEINWNAKDQRITGRSVDYVKAQETANAGSNDSNPSNATTVPASSNEAAPTTNVGGSAAAVGSPAAGGGASAGAGSITGAAESQLNALYSRSRSELFALAQEYVQASSAADKQRIMAQGESRLSSLTSEFESILSSTESQLRAGGYDTAVIDQYRARFNSEVAAGRALAASMAK